MKDSERARSLVRDIVRAARRAEALAKARGNKDFSVHADTVLNSIKELKTLRLLPRCRKEFATALQTQGTSMPSAMALGDMICNAAKALRTNSTPANTPTRPAPAPMPA